MSHDADVWQALRRVKGLTVKELSRRLGVPVENIARALAGHANGDIPSAELDRVLALGDEHEGRPLYALATLSATDGVTLLPAGDTQPLFANYSSALQIADRLSANGGVVRVVPVWPEYAWRNLVSFHAAWGSEAEPRSVFLVDDVARDVPLDVMLDELESGFHATLDLLRRADDRAHTGEIRTRFAAITGEPTDAAVRDTSADDEDDDFADVAAVVRPSRRPNLGPPWGTRPLGAQPEPEPEPEAHQPVLVPAEAEKKPEPAPLEEHTPAEEDHTDVVTRLQRWLARDDERLD